MRLIIVDMRNRLRDQPFMILASLAAGPQHGYGIIKDVLDLSDDTVRLRTGTLYGALDRLVDGGHIEFDREETVEGRVRRYYRITDTGIVLLEQETRYRLRVAEAGRQRLVGRNTNGAVAEVQT